MTPPPANAPGASGGLELASGSQGVTGAGDVFTAAIVALRDGARSLDTDPVDQYAQRANGAFPTWKEMQPRMEAELAAQQAAGEKMTSELRSPPINRGLPWVRMGAGMLKPTRTGSIGESMGHGLEGFSQGQEELQKHELDFARRAAESGYTTARDQLAGTKDMYRLGLQSEQIEAALQTLRQRIMTPAERFAAEQGARQGTPDWNRLVDVGRFMQGLSGEPLIFAKNMWANNPGISANELAAQAAKQQIKTELRKSPAFTGMSFRTPELSNQWLESEAEKIFQEQVGKRTGQPGAAPGAPAAPAPAPSPAAPPAGAPAPSAAAPDAGFIPVGSRGPQLAPEMAGLPYADFLAPPASSRQPDQMGGVEKELFLSRAKGQDAAALEQYSKTVAPGADNAAEAQAAVRAQALVLKSDPNMTGAGKEALAGIASWFVSAGLAPKGWETRVTNWQEFDSFVKKAMLGEQSKQAGVQTEGDAKRIQQALASMGKTPQANHFIMRYLDALAERAQERERFFSHYNEANGTYHGANARWMAYIRKHQLVREVKGVDGKDVILFDPEYRQYQRKKDEPVVAPPRT